MPMNLVTRGLMLVLALGLLASCGAHPSTSQAPRPAATAAPAGGPLREMPVQDLKAKLDAGEPLIVLDVRSPEEYRQDGHIAGSQLLPLPELEQRLGEVPADRPIACICRSGNRSRTACALLAQRGFTNVASVQGGMRAWAAAGYPSQ